MKIINVGLIGFGTVGSGVVKALTQDRLFLRNRLGFEIRVEKICDKDFFRKRNIKVKPGLLTKNPDEILNSESIDIVVELVGGIRPAKDFVLKALKNGKHVVTANKALLAQEGKAVFQKAIECEREVLFEAAVCGGIPIVKSLRESLISNEFNAIVGIINGTSNYVLSNMQEKGSDFKQALKEAQAKGFAERNASLDVDGFDAGHKAAILTYLAFGKLINFKDIFIEGISGISPLDIQYANELGYVIKPVAIVKKWGGKIDTRVHPGLIRKKHILASANGVINAVKVYCDMAKELVFIGLGAGQEPTASAVVSDIVDLSRSINLGYRQRRLNLPCSVAKKSELRNVEDLFTKYYIRFMTIDKPGVLSKISGVLGRYDISIASVTQKERQRAKIVPIVMMTHGAKEKNIQKALNLISKLNLVKRKTVVIRAI